MVELAAEKGMTLTTEEVRGFLRQMDEESEFDDIELDAVALVAIASGGIGGRKGCCQEEAHDEPWGRCPGMRSMRKWLCRAVNHLTVEHIWMASDPEWLSKQVSAGDNSGKTHGLTELSDRLRRRNHTGSMYGTCKASDASAYKASK